MPEEQDAAILLQGQKLPNLTKYIFGTLKLKIIFTVCKILQFKDSFESV
jgi:hypothetical protein